MEAAIKIILDTGESGVNTALYVLLPIMITLMIFMRFLEAFGVLRWISWLSGPLVRPLGLTGLGVVAMAQTSLVSFVAPIPVLALMERQGQSRRQIAATFAAILAMAPANGLFPLASLGVDVGRVTALSVVAGLFAAAVVYWGFGRNIKTPPMSSAEPEEAVVKTRSALVLINEGGREAIRTTIAIIPMLVLSLTVVRGLEQSGLIDSLTMALAPFLGQIGLDLSLVIPIITKLFAGGTALVGVASEMVRDGRLSPEVLDGASAFLLHPLDLPGLAIYVSAVPVLGRVLLPAMLGAISGIALRVVLQAAFF